MSTDTVSKDGTDGLVTVAKVDSRLGDMSRLSIIDRPLSIGTEVCLRSQAESEIRKVRKDAEDLLAEKEREIDELRDTFKQMISNWRDRAEKAEDELAAERAEKAGWKELHDAAQVAVKERTEACNSLYRQNTDLEAKLAAAEEFIKSNGYWSDYQWELREIKS